MYSASLFPIYSPYSICFGIICILVCILFWNIYQVHGFLNTFDIEISSELRRILLYYLLIQALNYLAFHWRWGPLIHVYIVSPVASPWEYQDNAMAMPQSSLYIILMLQYSDPHCFIYTVMQHSFFRWYIISEWSVLKIIFTFTKALPNGLKFVQGLKEYNTSNNSAFPQVHDNLCMLLCLSISSSLIINIQSGC